MGAERVKTYLRRLPQKQPVPLEKLYPKDMCHPDALDLLGKMLKLDPKERISVGEALSHKYLEKYHDIDDEPLCFPPFEFDFEDIPFTRDDLKARILKEIEQFHKDRVLILSPVNRSPKELQSCQVSSTQLNSSRGKDKTTSKKGIGLAPPFGTYCVNIIIFELLSHRGNPNFLSWKLEMLPMHIQNVLDKTLEHTHLNALQKFSTVSLTRIYFYSVS